MPSLLPVIHLFKIFITLEKWYLQDVARFHNKQKTSELLQVTIVDAQITVFSFNVSERNESICEISLILVLHKWCKLHAKPKLVNAFTLHADLCTTDNTIGIVYSSTKEMVNACSAFCVHIPTERRIHRTILIIPTINKKYTHAYYMIIIHLLNIHNWALRNIESSTSKQAIWNLIILLHAHAAGNLHWLNSLY